MYNFFLFFLLFLFACSGSDSGLKPKTGDTVYPVVAARAMEHAIPDVIEIEGYLVPSQSLQVKAPLTGEVSQMSLELGQEVQLDSFLLEIQPKSLEIKLARLRKELLAIESAPDLPVNPEPESNTELDDIQEEDIPDLEQGPDQVHEQRRDSGQLGAEEDLDEVGDRYPRRVLRPKSVAKTSRTAPKKARKSSATSLAQLRSEIQAIESELTRNQVKASLSGLVEKLEVNQGSLVKKHDLLLEIVEIDPIVLSVYVPRRHLSNLNKQIPVEILFGQRELAAQLKSIASRYDAEAGGLEYRIEVKNPGRRMKAGLQAKARFKLSDENKKALMIPVAALLAMGEDYFVYIVKGNLAYRRKVKLGPTIAEEVAVYSGIDLNDSVIIEGHETFDESREFIKVQ